MKISKSKFGSPRVESDGEDHSLLEAFLSSYSYVDELNKYVIPKLNDLVSGKYNSELPDDWRYFWGLVVPRKDFVWVVAQDEVDKIRFDRESDVRFKETWEGNVLLDANSIDVTCETFLKFSTTEFIAICKEWEDVKTRG
jgi:hypothetical protein